MSIIRASLSTNKPNGKVGFWFAIAFIFIFNLLIIALILSISLGIGNTPLYSSFTIVEKVFFNWAFLCAFIFDGVVFAPLFFFKDKSPILSPLEWLKKFGNSESFSEAKFDLNNSVYILLTNDLLTLNSTFRSDKNDKYIIYAIFLGALFCCFPILQVPNPFSVTTIETVYVPIILPIIVFGSIFLLNYILTREKSKDQLFWSFKKIPDNQIEFTIANPFSEPVHSIMDKSFFNDLRIHARKINQIYHKFQTNKFIKNRSMFVLNMYFPVALQNQPINNPYFLWTSLSQDILEQIKAIFTRWLSV